MQSGYLDKRITLQRDATVRGSTGGKKAWTTPATVAEVWARLVIPTTPPRDTTAGTNFPVTRSSYEWHIRHRDDVPNDGRVRWTRGTVTRYFEIRGIKRASMREQIMILETEEVQ